MLEWFRDHRAGWRERRQNRLVFASRPNRRPQWGRTLLSGSVAAVLISLAALAWLAGALDGGSQPASAAHISGTPRVSGFGLEYLGGFGTSVTIEISSSPNQLPNAHLDTDADCSAADGNHTLAGISVGDVFFVCTDSGVNDLHPPGTITLIVNGSDIGLHTSCSDDVVIGFQYDDAPDNNDFPTTIGLDLVALEVAGHSVLGCGLGIGQLTWEKRNDADGSLQGGATFTVGGASGPFDCAEFGNDSTNPVVVADNGPLDGDLDDGQVLLSVCAGTYTVTETVSPAGFDPDPDDTRDITVVGNATNSIGTMNQPDDCPDTTGAPDDDDADFCNVLLALPPTLAVEVVKTVDGDDADSTFTDLELTSTGSTVTYQVVIDNDSDVAVTVVSPLSDSVYGTITDCAGTNFNGDAFTNVIGEVLQADDGDGVGPPDGGPDEVTCTFQETAPSTDSTVVTDTIEGCVEGSTVVCDSDDATIQTPPVLGEVLGVEVVKTVDGDDADSTFTDDETTAVDSTVTYKVVIDNDSTVAVTIVSLVDDVYGTITDCLDSNGDNVIGQTLAADDGSDPGGADEVTCTFQETAPSTDSTVVTDVITGTVEFEGTQVSDNDDATIRTPAVAAAVALPAGGGPPGLGDSSTLIFNLLLSGAGLLALAWFVWAFARRGEADSA